MVVSDQCKIIRLDLSAYVVKCFRVLSPVVPDYVMFCR